jgi:hypothetical protein
MWRRLPITHVRKVPVHDVSAGYDAVNQRMGCARWLKAMDIPDVAQPDFSASPPLPFAVNPNEQIILFCHISSTACSACVPTN